MTQAPYVLVPASYQLATDSGCVELHIAYDNGRQLDILLESALAGPPSITTAPTWRSN